jgi:Uma2 family endonuclease
MVLAMAQPVRMTASEFLVAKASDPQRFHELINGVVVPNQPRPRHQDAAFEIAFRLRLWIDATGFGKVSLPLDIELDSENVYCPDVLWAANRGRFEADSMFDGMPDLIVEVRSPSTWIYDTRDKKYLYEKHGLPELWLVDTVHHTVLVFRRSTPEVDEFDVGLKFGADEVLTSPQLPGFELNLREVFPDE